MARTCEHAGRRSPSLDGRSDLPLEVQVTASGATWLDRRLLARARRRPALEQHVGRQVAGVVLPGGGVDWSFGRERGPGL